MGYTAEGRATAAARPKLKFSLLHKFSREFLCRLHNPILPKLHPTKVRRKFRRIFVQPAQTPWAPGGARKIITHPAPFCQPFSSIFFGFVKIPQKRGHEFVQLSTKKGLQSPGGCAIIKTIQEGTAPADARRDSTRSQKTFGKSQKPLDNPLKVWYNTREVRAEPLDERRERQRPRKKGLDKLPEMCYTKRGTQNPIPQRSRKFSRKSKKTLDKAP